MRCYMTARAVTWQLLTRAPVDLALALFRTCLSSFRLPPLRGSPESFCLRSLRACALGVDEAKLTRDGLSASRPCRRSTRPVQPHPPPRSSCEPPSSGWSDHFLKNALRRFPCCAGPAL